MNKLIIGFISTINDLTAIQKSFIERLISDLIFKDDGNNKFSNNEFHHGGKIGADKYVDDFITGSLSNLSNKAIFIHRTSQKNISYNSCYNSHTFKLGKKQVHECNRDIINISDVVIIALDWRNDENIDWPPLSYVVDNGKKAIIIYRDGKMAELNKRVTINVL